MLLQCNFDTLSIDHVTSGDATGPINISINIGIAGLRDDFKRKQ